VGDLDERIASHRADAMGVARLRQEAPHSPTSSSRTRGRRAPRRGSCTPRRRRNAGCRGGAPASGRRCRRGEAGRPRRGSGRRREPSAGEQHAREHGRGEEAHRRIVWSGFPDASHRTMTSFTRVRCRGPARHASRGDRRRSCSGGCRRRCGRRRGWRPPRRSCRAHGLGAVDARQVLDERDGRGVDAEHVKVAGLLAVAVERAEVEADVRDGPGGDGEVVALGPAHAPGVPSSSSTEPRKGLAIRRIVSPPMNALPTHRASVLAATRGVGSRRGSTRRESRRRRPCRRGSRSASARRSRRRAGRCASRGARRSRAARSRAARSRGGGARGCLRGVPCPRRRSWRRCSSCRRGGAPPAASSRAVDVDEAVSVTWLVPSPPLMARTSMSSRRKSSAMR